MYICIYKSFILKIIKNQFEGIYEQFEIFTKIG